MGESPAAPAVKAIEAVVLPFVATRDVGADGRTPGATGPDAADGPPHPALVKAAKTLK
jgi:hypothetical protein